MILIIVGRDGNRHFFFLFEIVVGIVAKLIAFGFVIVVFGHPIELIVDHHCLPGR
jgi:hypothetical protein